MLRDQSSSMIDNQLPKKNHIVRLVKECLCLQEKMLRIVDNLRDSRNIKIVEGVVLKSDSDVRSPKQLDALPVDPAARDHEVNARLLNGVVSLFETHALEVKMNQADKDEVQRSLDEG